MPEPAYWAQSAVHAVILCGFYMPLAVAFALVQGISNRIFLSFGDIAMFASFAAIYIALSRYVDGGSNASVFAASLLAAMACAAALGQLVARQVFAPLIRQPSLAFMIGAVGLSIILQEVMRMQSEAKTIWLPPLYGMEPVAASYNGAVIQAGMPSVIVTLVSFAVIALVCLAVKMTRYGRWWQACSQDARLAALSGVDVEHVLRLTCVVSSIVASLSGWTIAVSYGGVSFSLGLMAGFKAMFASVVGGFGTLSGAVTGAIFLAVAETLWSSMFPLAYRDAAIFSVITLILILKPEGLMGSPLRSDSGS